MLFFKIKKICTKIIIVGWLAGLPVLSFPGNIQFTLVRKSPAISSLTISGFRGTQVISPRKIEWGGDSVFCQWPGETGFYRISQNDSNFTDIILSEHETPVIEIYEGELRKNLIIKNSDENRMMAEFRKRKMLSDEKIKNYYITLSHFNETDSTWHSLKQLIRKTENENYNDIHSFLLSSPGLYFTKTTLPFLYVNNQCGYTGTDERGKRIFMKEHFFDRIDFSDPSLVHSTFLPNFIMKYFETVAEYDEPGFRQAIDSILGKTSANNEVYEVSLFFLMELFDKVGPSVIFEYLVEKYFLENSCGNSNTVSFSERAESYRRFQKGEMIPDYTFRDYKGETSSLHRLAENKEITLLFFWSTHCPFCKEALPVITEMKKKYGKKIQVIAVSLDENENEFRNFISKEKLSFLHICDLKGWESEPVKFFMVHKTPSLLVIGKDKIICAKNPSFTALPGLLDNLLK
ncbi:MAG: thioredoxin-like domain-containing protein [Bacteroidota bacterium]